MVWNKKIQAEMRRNRMTAVLMAGLTVFLGLSLLSYNPQDPSLNSFGLFPKVLNYCGFVGAVTADIFYQLMGFASWLFIPAGLRTSYKFFISRRQAPFWTSLLFFLMFILSFAGLLELHFSQIRFFAGEVGLGGVLGQSAVALLEPRLHFAGTAVVLWSCFFTVILSHIEVSFGSLWRSLKSFFIALPHFVGKIFLGGRRLFLSGLHLLLSVWDFLRQRLRGLFSLIAKGFLKAQLWHKKTGRLKSAFKPSQGEASRDKEKQSPFVAVEKKPSRTKTAEVAGASLGPRPSTTKGESPSLSADSKIKGPQSQALARAVDNPESKTDSPLWKLPSWNLLSPPSLKNKGISSHDVEDLSQKLVSKLSQFSIKGQITAVRTGPAVILFEFKPEEHIKLSRIREMAGDLSLALSSESVRIMAPIPGRDVVGIEASRPHREMVWLKDLLREEAFFKASLPLVLGRRADNQMGIRDLARIPHLLVAGTTGSGKSIFIISFITGLLFRHTPETLRLILVDPKQVDLSGFNDIPHLLAPVITSSAKAVGTLQWAIREMEKRYRSLSVFGVRDQRSFNEKTQTMNSKDKEFHEEAVRQARKENSYYYKPLPLIVIVIEEFGDLMADKNIRRSIENAVVRLAQKARACGIHLVLAMQSPRKDVVTGLIKTNIPGRISFKVASGTDSRVILDETGAERLLSHGDMLFLEPGSSKASRYHGPYVREKDVLKTAEHWKGQALPLYEEALSDMPREASSVLPSGAEDIKTDPMYNEILAFVKTCDVISASFLQRKFRIGYPRAGRIIEILYEEGKIGPPQGSKAREVLINRK